MGYDLKPAVGRIEGRLVTTILIPLRRFQFYLEAFASAK